MLHRLFSLNPRAAPIRAQHDGDAQTAADALCPLSRAPQREIPQPYRYWSRENGQLYDSRWLRQHLHGDAERRSPLTRRPMDADVGALWPEHRASAWRRPLCRWLDAHEGPLHISLVAGGTAALISMFLCVMFVALYEADPKRGDAATKTLYFAPLIPLVTLGLFAIGVVATSGLALGLRRAWGPPGNDALMLSHAEVSLFAPPPSPALQEEPALAPAEA